MLHFHLPSTSSQARNSHHVPAIPLPNPLPFRLGPACHCHFFSGWENCYPFTPALGLLPLQCAEDTKVSTVQIPSPKTPGPFKRYKMSMQSLKIPPDPAAMVSSGLNQVAELYSRGVNLNLQLCQGKSQAHKSCKIPC